MGHSHILLLPKCSMEPFSRKNKMLGSPLSAASPPGVGLEGMGQRLPPESCFVTGSARRSQPTPGALTSQASLARLLLTLGSCCNRKGHCVRPRVQGCLRTCCSCEQSGRRNRHGQDLRNPDPFSSCPFHSLKRTCYHLKFQPRAILFPKQLYISPPMFGLVSLWEAVPHPFFLKPLTPSWSLNKARPRVGGSQTQSSRAHSGGQAADGAAILRRWDDLGLIRVMRTFSESQR